MAYSTSNVDKTLLNDDMPLIVAANRLRDTSQLRWTSTGNHGGTDITDTDARVERLFDGFTHLKSKPGTGADPRYINIQFSSATSFDTIFITNHNLGTLGATVSADVSDTGSSGWTEFFTNTPANDNRILSLDLDDTGGGGTKLLSSVVYVRIKIAGSATIPQIGELILGERIQLRHKMLRPYGKYHYESDVVEHVSQSGVRTRTTFSRGRRIVDGTYVQSQTGDDATYERIWTESLHAKHPVIYIEDPSTTPTGYILAQMDPEFLIPRVGPKERRVRLLLTEQGPDYQLLET